MNAFLWGSVERDRWEAWLECTLRPWKNAHER